MDFLLTPSGDMTFELYESKTVPLNISFINSKTKALQISFYTEGSKTIEPSGQQLNIRFNLYKPTYNKAISIADSRQEMEQNIKNRLLTPKGTMPSCKELGSYLENYKHTWIDT